jgi:NDP-sugar pyrophosphorylase family protein
MQAKMQAVILAGGLGTRLRTLVNDRPKAMAHVNDKPFLEYQIDYLKKNNIDQIILCVGYLREKIQEYFGDGRNWDIAINYAVEKKLLGTAGALKNAEKYINSSFFVLNGDSFFDIDLPQMASFHQRKKSETDRCLGTIALVEVADKRNFGSIALDPDLYISAFEEKSTSQSSPGLINAGIYLLEPDVFQFIPGSQEVSIEKETFPLLLEKGSRLVGYQGDGFFVDIGSPEGFFTFQDFLREKYNDN